VFFLLLVACLAWELPTNIRDVELVAPKLGQLLRRTHANPAQVAGELRRHYRDVIAPVLGPATPRPPKKDPLPIVATHGMGDSCFNQGMSSITKAAGTHAGVYSVCIPGGPNQIEDTLSAFFINMNKNVDNFAAQVRNNTNLAHGFDAFGLSQGNAIIRGYIQKYNKPPVRNYLSIHGVDMGVSGFPNCNPAGILKSFCDALDEILGALAYNPTIQDILFQSNYFRDPMKMTADDYIKYSQIAQWNNENPATVNATLKTNFIAVKSYNMIKALKDTMVFPNEGEWWGEFKPGQFKDVLTMTQTPLYSGDNFGLKTVDSDKKIKFNSTTGGHLEFTVKQLEDWIDEYFV